MMITRIYSATGVALLALAGIAGLSVARDTKDSKDKPDAPSIAGQWKAARGDVYFNYNFKIDGTYDLQVKSIYFTQGKHGTWKQDGDKITVRQDDSGTPGTGGFSKGRDIDVKFLGPKQLQIDGDTADLLARAATSGPASPERMLSIADKLKSSGKYDPDGDVTKCNLFVRDFMKEVTGQVLPELAGLANDQVDQLAGSSDWDEAYLVFDEDAPGKGNGKTLQDLQDIQNRGKTVLYGYKDPEDKGHIAVGMPLKEGDKMPKSDKMHWGMAVPVIAQAGKDTFSYGPLSNGFGPDKKKKIKVFVYKK